MVEHKSVEEELKLPPQDIITEPERMPYRAPVKLTTILYTAPAEQEIPYYDVPLSQELQNTLFDLCTEYSVDPILALAIIQNESSFDETVISRTGDYGLMQINECNHQWLEEELGIDDIMNPEQNMRAGISMISGYLQKYDIHRALMSYNMGEGGARKLAKEGHKSSRYSRKVVAIMETIKLKGE